MMKRSATFAGAGLAALLATTPALAHAGHGDGGPLEALLHPLHGLEHLFAMIPADVWPALAVLAVLLGVGLVCAAMKIGHHTRPKV